MKLLQGAPRRLFPNYVIRSYTEIWNAFLMMNASPSDSAPLAGRTKTLHTDILVAVSLANLVTVPLWKDLVFTRAFPDNFYYMDGPPAVELSAMVALLSLGLALVFLGCRRLTARRPRLRLVGQWAFLACVVYGINVFRLGLPAAKVWQLRIDLLFLAGGAAALVLAQRGGHSTLGLARATVLAFSPFVLVILGQVATSFYTSKLAETFFDVPATPRRHSRASFSRIVVLVFDEFDKELAFDRRPASLLLPELDRLKRESWSAENAYPFTNWTISSIPAIVSGQPVLPLPTAPGPSLLAVRLAGRRNASTYSWASLPTIFAHAVRLGGQAGVVGMYHPYCRLFGALLVTCESMSTYVEPSLAEYPRLFGSTLARYIPGASTFSFAQADASFMGGPEEQLRRYAWQHERARTLVRARDLSLAYIHYTIPHLPAIFDRRNGAMRHGGGYEDNLALADRTVGELRHTLEAAGLWGTTALVVTSDHALRQGGGSVRARLVDPAAPANPTDPNQRVPMIVRLPTGGAGHSYPGTVSALATYDVVKSFLEGRVQSYADVTREVRSRTDALFPVLERRIEAQAAR